MFPAVKIPRTVQSLPLNPNLELGFPNLLYLVIWAVWLTYAIHFLGVLRRLLAELHRQGIVTEDLCLPDDFEDLELVYRGLCRRDEHSLRRRIGRFFFSD